MWGRGAEGRLSSAIAQPEELLLGVSVQLTNSQDLYTTKTFIQSRPSALSVRPASGSGTTWRE